MCGRLGLAAMMVLPGLVVAEEADRGRGERKGTAAAGGQDPYREEFLSRPRYLYGCGIIWAQWRFPEDKKRWNYDAESMDMIKAMGGTSVPINIPWADVETKRGKWDFEYVDHQVKEAEKRGLAMFAYMGLTPDWALPPEAPDKPGIGYRFPPGDEYEEAFVTYCRTVARRYQGRVKFYQFWNEPNGCGWVNDGCANGDQYARYTRWLKIWYKAMKRENPDCVLGAGALDYNAGVKEGYRYLEGMYREGAKDYFDAFNIHPYDGEGLLHFRAIEDTRRVMVAHGDGHKGLWLSEWGWPMADGPERCRRVIETLKALEDPKYYYVTMASYLSITDPGGEVGFGLCDRDLTPRPSYFAFGAYRLGLHKQLCPPGQDDPREGGTPAHKR
jgi:hypothetical protein